MSTISTSGECGLVATSTQSTLKSRGIRSVLADPKNETSTRGDGNGTDEFATGTTGD